ncbi:glutathione S-transferase family protein [Halocatena halophila]|uniref:glutathione S-transferase family protein n=1 Tax=Halocatena halophila TaxID=2814576 RepID=UPI002ED46BB4
MGQLINGNWMTETELTENPNRTRTPTTFRNTLGSTEFPTESNRYHLYASRACPWAHGVMLVRSLLGLEDEISMDIVDPHRQSDGWAFTPEKPGCTRDSQEIATPNENAIHSGSYLRDIYTRADPTYTGNVTVPVLWDTESETIVNNESIEIMRQLAVEYAQFGGNELYPAEQRERIDATIDELYKSVNTAVYRVGFADSQSEYDGAVHELFNALEEYDSRLSERRFLVGEGLTLADLRLFTTLVRFDPVYYTHFKCTRKRLVEYEHLWGFTRDLYQLQGVARTVNMDHIKEHYYRSHTDRNPSGLIPLGGVPPFRSPHQRNSLPGTTGFDEHH